MKLAMRSLLVLAAALGISSAAAQQYPTKPVRIVVAFTAGGTTDIMARMLAQKLTERFKQPFVIENKPGAGGNLGTEFVVRAPADGYTLIINSVGPMAVNPTLYKTLSYNPLTDLVPVAQISDVPNVLVADSSPFPTGAGYGPTLTLVALALRNARALAGLRSPPAG